MDAATATQPTVSLVKDHPGYHCLGNGVAALQGAYQRTADHAVLGYTIVTRD